MTRERRAQALTVAVLALLVAVLSVRRSGWSPFPPDRAAPGATPEETVYAMLDAARAGDVDRYLAHYSGQLREALEQAVEERTRAGFQRYLRESNAPVKGIAVARPEKLAPDAVKTRVEFVYQDRNEIQLVYLERVGGRWFITRLDAAQRVPAAVPYGTPVE
jgi:hypothetical protein